MTDSPHVEDDDQPFVHNPIRALPWIDSKTEVEVFQHRPGQSTRLAEWCGGEVVFVDALAVRVPIAPDADRSQRRLAYYGDFVVLADGEFSVEPADGFNLRFWPKGRDPGWSHRCFMDWEAP